LNRNQARVLRAIPSPPQLNLNSFLNTNSLARAELLQVCLILISEKSLW
jgi:hypothetical protein